MIIPFLILLKPSHAKGWELHLLINSSPHGHDVYLLSPNAERVWTRNCVLGTDAIVEACRDMLKRAAGAGYEMPIFDMDEVRRKASIGCNFAPFVVDDPLGQPCPWPARLRLDDERPDHAGGNVRPRHAGGVTVISEVQQTFGDFVGSGGPTLTGDPRFPGVSATVSRFGPENEDALTVTLRNAGTATVEGYAFSLHPPTGREGGANIGVSGSHPYDWTETPEAPNDGGWHITVNRLVPGMHATLDFELVPVRRMNPERALAHAACISEDDAPRAIEILREVGYELTSVGGAELDKF